MRTQRRPAYDRVAKRSRVSDQNGPFSARYASSPARLGQEPKKKKKRALTSSDDRLTARLTPRHVNLLPQTNPDEMGSILFK